LPNNYTLLLAHKLHTEHKQFDRLIEIIENLHAHAHRPLPYACEDACLYTKCEIEET